MRPSRPIGQAERGPQDPAHRPGAVLVAGRGRQQPVALDDVGGLVLQRVRLQDRERRGRELARVDVDREPVEGDRPRPAAGQAAVHFVGVADGAVERDPEADSPRSRPGPARRSSRRTSAAASPAARSAPNGRCVQVGDHDRRRQRRGVDRDRVSDQPQRVAAAPGQEAVALARVGPRAGVGDHQRAAHHQARSPAAGSGCRRRARPSPPRRPQTTWSVKKKAVDVRPVASTFIAWTAWPWLAVADTGAGPPAPRPRRTLL